MASSDDWDYATGWIKFPRALIELLTQTDPARGLLTVYAVLLNRVTWSAKTIMTRRGSVYLETGQCVFGRDELASACGLTVRSLRTAIGRLEKLGIVTTQSTSEGTIATLCRFKETYDERQADRPANRPAGDQPATSPCPAGDQPAPTNLDLEILRSKDPRESGGGSLVSGEAEAEQREEPKHMTREELIAANLGSFFKSYGLE